MNRRFSSGKSQLIGQGIEYPVPIPLNPAAYKGTVVYGDSGQMYLSDGMEWRSIADEARVAQIAKDVAFDTVRVVDEEVQVTVHMSNPAADFTSLRDALDFFSLRVPSLNLPQLPFTVLILSGHVETKQIQMRTGFFGSVRVIAEDEEVICDEDGIVEPASTGSGWPFFEFFVTPPVISCLFRSNQSWPDDTTFGMLVRNGYYANGTAEDNEDSEFPKCGFTHFGTNLSLRFGGGGRLLDNISKHSNARRDNITLYGGTFANVEGDVSGAERYGLVVRNSFASLLGANFRKAEGIDSSDDIRVEQGSIILITGLSDSRAVLGGTNQPAHVQTNNGLILDVRAAQLASFYATAAALPSASLWPNRFTMTGDEGPVVSNGTDWLPITTGAPL